MNRGILMRPFIVYDSMTGNVKRFVSKLGYESVQIQEGLLVDKPFILVTYTIGYGEIPKSTMEFLKRSSIFLLGVASSGNKNWGANFAKAGNRVSALYGKPLIHTFELSGTEKDVDIFKQEVERLCQQASQNGYNITTKS